MDYSDGKAIIDKLDNGVRSRVPATFVKTDEPRILNLIDSEMISPAAFLHGSQHTFTAQNLDELHPVTGRGRQLFGGQPG